MRVGKQGTVSHTLETGKNKARALSKRVIIGKGVLGYAKIQSILAIFSNRNLKGLLGREERKVEKK